MPHAVLLRALVFAFVRRRRREHGHALVHPHPNGLEGLALRRVVRVSSRTASTRRSANMRATAS